jgi:hypothetical protein
MGTQSGSIVSAFARRSLRHFGATLLMALALATMPASAARTDFTDLWWNPAEPGWGVNLVQAQTFLFATFFVYGPGNQPVWYTGEMTRDAAGAYAGPLYVTTGTPYNAPENPAHKSARQVGSVTFTPSAATAGSLAYTVDGTVITKMVQRQTLQTIPLGDTFIGGLVSQWSGCTDPSVNSNLRRHINLRVTQVAADRKLEVDLDLNGTTCKVSGAYVQQGQLYTMPGATYYCSNGLSTTADVSELRSTARGIEGRWKATTGGGCTESVTFSAVLAM